MRRFERFIAVVALISTGAHVVCAREATKREILPPKPERVVRIAATFCHSLSQIKEVIRLTLAGNSPEEALMQVNFPLRVKLCERGSWPVHRPTIVRLYETANHAIAIYKVETPVGARYVFLAIRRFSI